jgi:microcystin-dependent protein
MGMAIGTFAIRDGLDINFPVSIGEGLRPATKTENNNVYVDLDKYQLILGKYNKQDNDKAFIIGNGTADNTRSNALTVDWNGNVIGQAMAGIIQMYAGAATQTITSGIATVTGVPDGWLICDGSELLKSEYPELAAALGNTWGTPSSPDYFKLPDLRGRAPIGTNSVIGDPNVSARLVGTQIGEETHTLVAAEIPAHTHGSSGAITGGITGGSHSHHTAYKTLDRTKDNKLQDTRVGPYGTSTADTTQVSTDAQTHTHNLPNHTHTSFGGGGAHENMQPSAVVNFIICTGKTY